MFSKFINYLLIVLLFLILWIPTSAKAANEFSTSYDLNYSVSEDGNTRVTENIKLKNLTDKFFPSSFTLVVPSKELTSLQATDAQGGLQVESAPEGEGTRITVKFTNQQIIGINKEYLFKLVFDDKETAKNLGKVWSIKIPKITQQTQVDNFKLVLSVPSSFGDPDYISPPPSKVSEVGGKINFDFIGADFFESGVSAIFGSEVNFSFETLYSLSNNSLFPKYINVPIGINSNAQKTYIETIEPRPENTEIDKLGNMLAIFKVNPSQTLDVKVNGFVKTYLNSPEKVVLNGEEIKSYLESNKYSESNNAAIKTKLGEILKGRDNLSALAKAKEIDKYVSNFLHFDYSRINSGDFTRFGSLTALNNPNKALSAEFTDTEIALLKAAEIPARQLIGFSIPQPNKPFSFSGPVLHSWLEFYNPESGWLVADPAWQNTTSGAVLFNFNDLSHIGLAYSKGENNFVLPYKATANVLDGEINERKGAELDIQVNSEILSGFPAKAKVVVRNLGNTDFPESELRVDSSKILIEQYQKEGTNALVIPTPEIPPAGVLEYDFNLKTGAIWQSYQDAFQVTFAGATDTRIITVKPILAYKIFAVEIIGGLIIIILFYIFTVLLHHKTAKSAS